MRRPIAAIAAVTIAASAVLGTAVALAHTPDASLGCSGAKTVLTVDLVDYESEGTNTVSLTVDGHGIVSETFATEWHYSDDTLDPTKAHTAVVDVAAWDDPDGSEGWSWHHELTASACVTPTATPTPRPTATPPPNTPRHYRPAAHISAPCADPMFRVTLDNRHSTGRVTYHITWHDEGDVRTANRTLRAGQLARTRYWHGDGRTSVIVTARARLLDRDTLPPGGWYGPCKS